MQRSFMRTRMPSGWQGGLACTAMVGPMVDVPVDLAGSLSSSGSLPLAVTVWMFIGVAIWIVQRWGRGSRAPVPASPPDPVPFKRGLPADT